MAAITKCTNTGNFHETKANRAADIQIARCSEFLTAQELDLINSVL